MKLINLLKCNFRRMMKNKLSFVLTFLMPIVVLFGIGLLTNSSPEGSRSYFIVNNDQGKYGKELVEELSNSFNIKQYSKEEAVEKLKKKMISQFYEIEGNFSDTFKSGQRPKLLVNRRESIQSFSDFEMRTRDLVNKLVISARVQAAGDEKVNLKDLSSAAVEIKVTSTKSTGMASQMTINLLISFNLFAAIGMCYELSALRSERTLRRSLTSANSPRTILGAVLGAQFIIVFISYTIIFLSYAFVNDRALLQQAPIIILNLMMISAVSLSLAIFVARLVKNESLIVIVLQIILCGTCFIGGSFMPVEYLPKSISFFSRFTPQYWAIESIKSVRYEYSLIVLLFAVLLFTAGTVSARGFAEVN